MVELAAGPCSLVSAPRVRGETGEGSGAAGHAAGSILFCALSLLSQLVHQYYLVSIGDFSALSDTAGFTLMASVVMAAVTIVINLLVFHDVRKREPRP